MKYYIKQINPRLDTWHVCSSGNNLPVYDNETNGNDKPLVFRDYDNAIKYRDELNNLIEEELVDISL